MKRRNGWFNMESEVDDYGGQTYIALQQLKMGKECFHTPKSLELTLTEHALTPDSLVEFLNTRVASVKFHPLPACLSVRGYYSFVDGNRRFDASQKFEIHIDNTHHNTTPSEIGITLVHEVIHVFYGIFGGFGNLEGTIETCAERFYKEHSAFVDLLVRQLQERKPGEPILL